MKNGSDVKGQVLGMVLKGYPRISETFISNEIFLLEKMGFRIHIISMRHPRENFSHDSVKKIKAPVDYLPHTIRGHVIKLMIPNVKLFIRRPGQYLDALKLALKRFLRNKKAATFKHLLQAGYVTVNVLPDSGIERLHAHFAHSPTSVTMFIAKLSGLPFSFTAHAKDIYTSHPGQLREKMAMADFVATCTEYNRQYLKNISGFNGTSIHRMYHGIDVRLFNGNGNRPAPSPPYQTLTVARLTEKKGLPTVLKAVRILLDQGLDLNHTLIGDGDDREKIIRLIDDLGLTGKVKCVGPMPHHEVLEYYLSSDLFVLGCEVADSGDRDGIPNVFVESMAMGLPVVGTRVSAIPELVSDEETGLLVEPGDYGGMAQAMKRLLQDSALRHRLIKAARRKVKEEFDNQSLIVDLADLFKNVGLTTKSPPS